MIKFFRNIRQGLLEEQKIQKYLLYAIGEILLIVIGIVIAVQIGNWNERLKRKKLEKVLLSHVVGEILMVRNDIDSDLHELTLGKRSSERILSYIEEDISYADSMCFEFGLLIADEYIYSSEAVYGRIQEEGLDIIRNDSIKDGLQNLYGNLFPRLNKIQSFYPDISLFFSEYYQDHFRPNNDMSLMFLIDSTDFQRYPIDFKTVDGKATQRTAGFVPLDFDSLKEDAKFQMLLIQARQYRNYKIWRYNLAKVEIDLIISLIERELAS